MARLVVFILGAAIVLGAGYYYVTNMGGDALLDDPTAKGQRALENVREAAGRIEGDAQERVDKLLQE